MALKVEFEDKSAQLRTCQEEVNQVQLEMQQKQEEIEKQVGASTPQYGGLREGDMDVDAKSNSTEATKKSQPENETLEDLIPKLKAFFPASNPHELMESFMDCVRQHEQGAKRYRMDEDKGKEMEETAAASVREAQRVMANLANAEVESGCDAHGNPLP